MGTDTRSFPRVVPALVSGSVGILVLGGTAFVGRAIVADALRAGAEVTLFGRGKTGAGAGGIFPGLPVSYREGARCPPVGG
jgi:hypothetical protein